MLRCIHILKPAFTMDAIRKQVFKTFAENSSPGNGFTKNVEKLLHLMNELTAEDVKLDMNLLTPQTSNVGPVSYIEIVEHPKFTINMFVLRPETQLPLHDHPLMHGICKVIHGKIRIKTFSINKERVAYNSEKIVAYREPDKLLGSKDPAILLTPTRGNIHEIIAVDAGAAFVDVLAPPYLSQIDGKLKRICHYFIESEENSDGEGYKELIKVQEIPGYWTDIAPYLGP